MYIDFEYFKSIYGETVDETTFNRLAWDACRKADIATTGIDNVRKLAIAFPTDDYDAEAVKRCICSLINIAHEIEKAKETANSAKGYTETNEGLRGNVITSMSAGNESISYSVGSSSTTATMIDKALADKAVQDKLYADAISESLSGITDANGVNLLYMGRYPKECLAE